MGVRQLLSKGMFFEYQQSLLGYKTRSGDTMSEVDASKASMISFHLNNGLL